MSGTLRAPIKKPLYRAFDPEVVESLGPACYLTTSEAKLSSLSDAISSASDASKLLTMLRTSAAKMEIIWNAIIQAEEDWLDDLAKVPDEVKKLAKALSNHERSTFVALPPWLVPGHDSVVKVHSHELAWVARAFFRLSEHIDINSSSLQKLREDLFSAFDVTVRRFLWAMQTTYITHRMTLRLDTETSDNIDQQVQAFLAAYLSEFTITKHMILNAMTQANLEKQFSRAFNFSHVCSILLGAPTPAHKPNFRYEAFFQLLMFDVFILSITSRDDKQRTSLSRLLAALCEPSLYARIPDYFRLALLTQLSQFFGDGKTHGAKVVTSMILKLNTIDDAVIRDFAYHFPHEQRIYSTLKDRLVAEVGEEIEDEIGLRKIQQILQGDKRFDLPVDEKKHSVTHFMDSYLQTLQQRLLLRQPDTLHLEHHFQSNTPAFTDSSIITKPRSKLATSLFKSLGDNDGGLVTELATSSPAAIKKTQTKPSPPFYFEPIEEYDTKEQKQPEKKRRQPPKGRRATAFAEAAAAASIEKFDDANLSGFKKRKTQSVNITK